jgi:RNA polymerase sigma-70 factor (ECF subfamily)
MDEPQTTRLTLLVRIRDRQDGPAWGEFVEIYSPGVYRFLRRRGLQDADACDVTQDVFRTVARSIDSFECDPQRGSFRGWLMSVVRSRLHDHLDAQRRQVAGTGDTATMQCLAAQPSGDGEDEAFQHEYRRSLFDWAASQLRPQFRESTWQAFWQTSVEGRPAKEVAAALGLSERAVYIAKCRVLAELRKKIQGAEES